MTQLGNGDFSLRSVERRHVPVAEYVPDLLSSADIL